MVVVQVMMRMATTLKDKKQFQQQSLFEGNWLGTTVRCARALHAEFREPIYYITSHRRLAPSRNCTEERGRCAWAGQNLSQTERLGGTCK